MKVEELVPLANGLSVMTGSTTLVCDRARIKPVRNDAVDVKFWIVGTDFVPGLRLTRERIDRGTSEELARIVRRIALRVVTG